MDRVARRSHVLDCARRVFGHKGYHATSISDIIKEAGIARGTFYLYFDAKRAIFDELLDGFFQRIDGCIQRVDPAKDTVAVMQQLIANVQRILDLLSSDQEMTRIVLHEAEGLDARFDQKLDDFYRRIVGQIEASLGLGVEMGLLRRTGMHLAALSILGAIKELMSRGPSGFENPEARHEAAVEMLRLFWAGLANPDLNRMLP